MEVAAKDDVMAPSDEGKEKALATPVARAMAKQMGIDINQVPGSGPSGRGRGQIYRIKKKQGSHKQLLLRRIMGTRPIYRSRR